MCGGFGVGLRCIVDICVYGHIHLVGRTLRNVLPFVRFVDFGDFVFHNRKVFHALNAASDNMDVHSLFNNNFTLCKNWHKVFDVLVKVIIKSLAD